MTYDEANRPRSRKPGKIVCLCGRGYASQFDGLCTPCRGMTAWEAAHPQPADIGEAFRAIHERTRTHRAQMLAQANTEGWTKHTDYHFSRVFSGKRMDWWPSGGKAQIDGRMIYGHRKVNDLIAILRRVEEE